MRLERGSAGLRIAVADGYSSHGEPVRRVRNRSGKVAELWLAATKLLPEDKVAKEIEARYAKGTARKAARRSTRTKSGRRR